MKTFAELEQRIAALPNDQAKGDAFEVFAEAYLATQRNHEVAEIWPSKVTPLALLAELALTVNDYGVDGVCKTELGRFDAYQVKFRTGRPALTWRELSTFMGLADSTHFQSRIVFTNCNELPAVLNERKGFFCIRGSDLDRLQEADFREIENWLASAVVERRRKTPDENHKHQAEALAEILSKFQRYDRTSAIMACGSGKTLLALWVAEQLGSAKVLVLLPSLALLRQTLHEWLHETSWKRLAYLCVCSDPTVAAELDTIHTQPSDLDFPVDTDSVAVRKFLDAEFNRTKIVFSTYQSAHIVAQGMKAGDAFDVGIFDEAHKTAGREGRKFSFALEDANLPIRKRLFLTATPRHYDIAKRTKEGDSTLVYSMDKPATYGPVAYKLPFPEATRRGIICDYKVVISIITSEMVNEERRRRGIVLVDGAEVKAQQVANQIALAKAVEKYQVRRIFTFHSSIRSAESFTAAGPEGIQTELTDFSAFHVNGSMATSLRERCMNDFRAAAKAVMSNARCLTEGVDVPAVDMVAFMSPRRSTVDIVQATGRAIRRSGDKTTGYVLVPLYLEQPRGETVEEAVKRGGFDEIWNVLQSLKEHDDVLADIIRELREERGRTKGFNDSRFREKVEVLGPELSLDDLRKAITAACVDALGISWDERYGELVAYKERFGSCEMPVRWLENPKLAKWVVQQRQNKKRNRLTKEQIQLLDKIEFVWQPKSRDWRAMYLRLLEYKKAHGNCNVPQKWSKDMKLARWVSAQRQEKSEGKITEERLRLLDGIGFEWNRGKPDWEHRFQQLVEYKNKHGHCDIPARWKENHQLASFVISQRQDRKAGTLTEEQIRRLDEIQFVWRMQDKISEALWMKKYEQLRGFKEKNGHCLVPKDIAGLANWVAQQRKRRKKGLLSDQKLTLLNAIGFIWDAGEQRSAGWETMFSRLVEYKAKVGDCRVPPRWKPDIKLGKWVMTQRRERRKGILKPDRERRLAGIDFDWQPFDSKWEEMLVALKAYGQGHGNCNVPKVWPDNPSLSKWVRRQRTLQNKQKLSADRVSALSALGFCWIARDAEWDEMFNELVEYYKIHGHCNVPQQWPANPQLGHWVQVQRRFRKLDRLPENRIQKLSEIGFEWEIHAANWEQRLEELVAFKAEHGHVDVPKRWKANPKLAQWVRVQRGLRATGKLSQDRIDRLDAVGFVWRAHMASWDEMLAALRLFHAEHNHCRVPGNWPSNPKLANWVKTQRGSKAEGALSPERVSALNQLGFEWSLMPGRRYSTKESWEAMLAQLAQFRAEHQHARVPQTYSANLKLARWVSTQRRYRRKGKLTPSQIVQLDQLGFDWSPTGSKAYDDQWSAMFQLLQDYRKQTGHCRVPRSYPEDPILARWVATQRRQKKLRQLRPERLSALDQIGFDWTVAPETNVTDIQAWDVMFEVLKQYKSTHGDCLVPQRWRENRKLAEWVSKQRIQNNKGRLDPARKRRLDELGFVWDPVTVKWEEWFAKLVEFRRIHGHTNVPQKVKQYEQLANWVRNQRRDYKMKRPIMHERAKRLNEIGFSWRLVEPQGWEKMFAALVEYKNAHGNCNVPQRWHEKRLAKWVNTQRTTYKRGKLLPERQRQLESIGFVWNAAIRIA